MLINPLPVKKEYAVRNGCITCFEVTKCPKCDMKLDEIQELCDVNFCPNCGQELSWEDSDERDTF